MKKTAKEVRLEIQGLLGVKQDDHIGKITRAAFERLVNTPPDEQWPPKEDAESKEWNTVKASSFADAKDVEAFKRCKARGFTDQFCFSQGDNGVGFTGIDCTSTTQAICALPKEVWMERWGSKAKASGKPVIVKYKGLIVNAILGDTMPALANIENGAGIDINPGLARSLRLQPPFFVDGVQWKWG